MQSSIQPLRAAGAVFALALLLGAAACSNDNNAGPNAPAAATDSTGHSHRSSPAAGVGPTGAGPAGSQ